jgi:small subunit ribosomal protein S6e
MIIAPIETVKAINKIAAMRGDTAFLVMLININIIINKRLFKAGRSVLKLSRKCETMAKSKSMFKIVVSDPKTGKAIQIETQDTSLIGKKLGEVIDGSLIGLEGYKLRITGGSGFEGAPMVPFVEGQTKKKVWWQVNKHMRVKKLVRGNTISEEIVQVNTVIEEYGSKPFEEIYNEWKQSKPQEQ